MGPIFKGREYRVICTGPIFTTRRTDTGYSAAVQSGRRCRPTCVAVALAWARREGDEVDGLRRVGRPGGTPVPGGTPDSPTQPAWPAAMPGDGAEGECYYRRVAGLPDWEKPDWAGTDNCRCMVCECRRLRTPVDRRGRREDVCDSAAGGAHCGPPGHPCSECGKEPCRYCGMLITPGYMGHHHSRPLCGRLARDFQAVAPPKKKRVRDNSQASTSRDGGPQGPGGYHEASLDTGMLVDHPQSPAPAADEQVVLQPEGPLGGEVPASTAIDDGGEGNVDEPPEDMAAFARFAFQGMDGRHQALVLALLHHPQFSLEWFRETFTKVGDFKRKLLVDSQGELRTVKVDVLKAPKLHEVLGGGE